MRNPVLLRRGDAGGENVFFIHAGNGEIQNYLKLCASLPRNFSCWGVRAQGFRDYFPRNETIESMASAYLDLIRPIQSHGPYLLAGWCFGGVRAFEMARQLVSAGEGVPRVILFNAHGPLETMDEVADMVTRYSLLNWGGCGRAVFSSQSEADLCSKWLASVGIDWSSLHTERDFGVWTRFVEAFHDGPHEAALKASIDTDIPTDRAMAIPFYDQITLERLMYYLAVMRSDANAQAFYSPQGSCRLRVLFINALSAPAAGSERWTQYASDVEYVSVDADHFSMFTQPAVGIISNLLTESLS